MTAGRRLKGRDHCLGFEEIVRTGTAAVHVGSADLRPLQPARFNPRTKILGILHHKKDLPMLEFSELQPLVGVLLHGTNIHILLGHTAGSGGCFGRDRQID